MRERGDEALERVGLELRSGIFREKLVNEAEAFGGVGCVVLDRIQEGALRGSQGHRRCASKKTSCGARTSQVELRSHAKFALSPRRHKMQSSLALAPPRRFPPCSVCEAPAKFGRNERSLCYKCFYACASCGTLTVDAFTECLSCTARACASCTSSAPSSSSGRSGFECTSCTTRKRQKTGPSTAVAIAGAPPPADPTPPTPPTAVRQFAPAQQLLPAPAPAPLPTMAPAQQLTAQQLTAAPAAGSAPAVRRRHRCGVCAGCAADDCGTCRACRDKPKFGGGGKGKQACEHRHCAALSADPQLGGSTPPRAPRRAAPPPAHAISELERAELERAAAGARAARAAYEATRGARFEPPTAANFVERLGDLSQRLQQVYGPLPFAKMAWETTILGNVVGVMCSQATRNSWSSINYTELGKTYPKDDGDDGEPDWDKMRRSTPEAIARCIGHGPYFNQKAKCIHDLLCRAHEAFGSTSLEVPPRSSSTDVSQRGHQAHLTRAPLVSPATDAPRVGQRERASMAREIEGRLCEDDCVRAAVRRQHSRRGAVSLPRTLLTFRSSPTRATPGTRCVAATSLSTPTCCAS